MTLGRATHLSFYFIDWGTFFSEWRFNLKKQRKNKNKFQPFYTILNVDVTRSGGCFVVLDCSWLNPVIGILLNYCDVSIDTYYCAAEVISCCSCYSLWSPRKRKNVKKSVLVTKTTPWFWQVFCFILRVLLQTCTALVDFIRALIIQHSCSYKEIVVGLLCIVEDQWIRP